MFGISRAAALACVLWAAAAVAHAALPQEVQHVQQWAATDAQGLPFAIVDKQRARLHVFDARGKLLASSPALLGADKGDLTVPGVGERAQTGEVAPGERTTPAGRFLTQPGRNLKGEHVVWVDYAAAFAIHRLRPGASQRKREAQLASPTPDDNRASLGCVVVPVDFYLSVVQPVLGSQRAVVYVLPENGRFGDLVATL